MKEAAVKELRKQIGQIQVFVDYGDYITNINKGSDKFFATLEKFVGTVDAFTKLVPDQTATFAGVLTAGKALIALAKNADEQTRNARILAFVAISQDALKKTRDELKDKKVLKKLTENEVRAYNLWSACALERLWFVRDCFPPVVTGCPSKYDEKALEALWKAHHVNGITRSSVVEAVSAYSIYISEREAFLARRPDYSALVDAIINANEKALKVPDDPGKIFDGITGFENGIIGLREKLETLRKAQRALNK